MKLYRFSSVSMSPSRLWNAEPTSSVSHLKLEVKSQPCSVMTTGDAIWTNALWNGNDLQRRSVHLGISNPNSEHGSSASRLECQPEQSITMYEDSWYSYTPESRRDDAPHSSKHRRRESLLKQHNVSVLGITFH